MTSQQLQKMIDAGIKEVDLYEVARGDVITNGHLRRFLKAALAAAPASKGPRSPQATVTPEDQMDEQYLVWSNEHRCWWRPNSAGYTRDVREAGRYSRAEAIDISGTARDGWRDPTRLPEALAISIQDLPPEIFASILSVDRVGGSTKP